MVSEPHYHTGKIFSKNLIAIEMKQKTNKQTNKQKKHKFLQINLFAQVYQYEIWHDYMKLKYNEKTKSCYMDTDSFLFHVKTEDIQEDTAKEVEKRFDTSNYELQRLLPKGKKQKK